MTISKPAGSTAARASTVQAGWCADRVGEGLGLGLGPVGEGQRADARQGERHGNGLPDAPGPDQQHPRARVQGPMRRQGLDHPDAVKGLADQPAIRFDPDGVDDPTGLGVREQRITQLGYRRLVWHGHRKPSEIPQVPHACNGRGHVCGRHLEGDEDGIDAMPVETGRGRGRAPSLAAVRSNRRRCRRAVSWCSWAGDLAAW